MQSLLLALGTTLGSDDNFLNDSLRLVLLRNGKSLSVLGELVEHVTALSASVSVGVVSHVGGRGALFALDLQLGDLAGVVDIEVLKNGLGSLLVLVADLLGLGVNLLLSLLLTTAKAEDHVNGGLIFKAEGLNGALTVEDSQTVDQHDLLSGDAGLLGNLLPI